MIRIARQNLHILIVSLEKSENSFRDYQHSSGQSRVQICGLARMRQFQVQSPAHTYKKGTEGRSQAEWYRVVQGYRVVQAHNPSTRETEGGGLAQV